MNRLLSVVVVFFALLVVWCILGLPGAGEFVSADRAQETLKAEGARDAHITAKHSISPHWVGGCGGDDAVAFTADVLNVTGERVTIRVCCGLWRKGCTIRY